MAASVKSSDTHAQWNGGNRTVGVGHLVSHILDRTTQDAQERLIFRAGIFIRSVIAPWRYSYTDVLPYLRAGHPPEHKLQPGDNFPTVTHTTELLEQIHNSLEKVVFDSLAEEAVRRCTTQLVQLSELIVSYKGPRQAEFPELEASLFLIRHLQHLNHSLRDYRSQGEHHFEHVEKSIDLLASFRERQFQVREDTIYTSAELKRRTEEACNRFRNLTHQHASGMVAGEATAEQAEQYLTKVREVTSFYITHQLSLGTLLEPLGEVFKPLGAQFGGPIIGPPDALSTQEPREITLHSKAAFVGAS